MWYISSWIDVIINLNPGGYFYGKTKENDTRAQSIHQQSVGILKLRSNTGSATYML